MYSIGNVLHLENPALFVGKTRGIYQHPHDDSLFIKIAFSDNYQNGSLDELREYLRLVVFGFDLAEFISPLYGLVETNLGYGLVVDKIRNWDGGISKTLKVFLSEGVDDELELKLVKKIDLLISKFNLSNTIFQDAHYKNIVLKFSHNGDFDLVVVDGFVGRADLKNYLRRKYHFLLIRKNAHSREKLVKSVLRARHI